MSTLQVKVREIKEIKSHSNADRLELATVEGWQCVVPKGRYDAGDMVVYFPPDTVLSQEWTDKFGVTNYCQKTDQGMRIRQARLRGEPSFGLVVDMPDMSGDWVVGFDAAEFYGAKKYEPPVLGKSGDILGNNHALFDKFTEIENLRNFPDILIPGEEVICTEKIHGTQVRGCYIREGGRSSLFWGSKNHPRKKPETEEEMKSNFYWYPWTLAPVRSLMTSLHILKNYNVVQVIGETYGRVQSLRYGLNSLAFRLFALKLDGKYIDFDERMEICNRHGVSCVPVIYRGPFDIEKIKEISNGNTLVADVEQIREGVVVQPVVERTDPRVGRVILKYVGDDYLLSKNPDKDTTDA